MTQLNTTITDAVVYLDRARITRSGMASLEAGMQRLEISGLPLQLNLNSLRAAAHGPARSRLLGVQAQRAFFTEAPAEQVRDLEAQMEAIQDELRSLSARAELLKQSRAALNTLAGQSEIFATALAGGEISLEGQLDLFDGLRSRAGQLDAELLEVARNTRDLERQLQKLKNELDRWRGAPRRENYTAAVEVEVIQPGDLTVDLTYVVSGASWQPLYDLRLLEDGGSAPTLEVGYLAQVVQQTGESWEQVALTLSTARPALAGTLPELDAWYIRPMPAPRPASQAAPGPARMGPMSLKMAEADTGAMADELSMDVAAEISLARVDASGAAITYHVPGTVSIPADGAPHKVAVASYRLDPKLDYVAAPRLVEAVYRRARVNNASSYTLLPGSASLFAGDEYIGTTRLELTAPQEEIELYLGVDDRVKVERELKRREVDKRLIGSRRSLHYGYEIKLENLLAVPIEITLQDQIPVSRHEEIKVRLDTADPKPSEQTELNLLNWKLALAPQEKRLVRFDFSVDYPQSMDVIGLP